MSDQVKLSVFAAGIKLLVMLADKLDGGAVSVVATSVAIGVAFNSVSVIRPGPPAGPGSVRFIAKLGDNTTAPADAAMLTNPSFAEAFNVAVLTAAVILSCSPALGIYTTGALATASQ